MASTSQESLTLKSTRSSTRSNMKIDMPASPSSFIQRSPAYTLAPTPAPSHSLDNSSLQPHEDHHSHGHRVHISTPHPLAATTNFLDKHVPIFAKHHTEFQTGHDSRAAKREARRSLIDSPIPEVDGEHLPSGSLSAAVQAVTTTAAAPALADSHTAVESQAWKDVLAKREAARVRSGSHIARPDEKLLSLVSP